MHPLVHLDDSHLDNNAVKATCLPAALGAATLDAALDVTPYADFQADLQAVVDFTSQTLPVHSAPSPASSAVHSPSAIHQREDDSHAAFDEHALWLQAVTLLRKRLSQPSFETWIHPLRFQGLWEKQAHFMTDSAFIRDWVLKNYRAVLLECLNQARAALEPCGTDACASNAVEALEGLHIVLRTTPLQSPPHLAEQQFADASLIGKSLIDESLIDESRIPNGFGDSLQDRQQDRQQRPRERQSSAYDNRLEGAPERLGERLGEPAPWTPRTQQSQLNPRYTFEHFVVGQHNRFPHAAALAVAENPAQAYNPFFVYGASGLGKTHLVQAIGHFVLRHHPDLRLRYVTAEQFTNELIASFGSGGKGMGSFRDRYRKNDLLIIDDIQFLEGKERTQEEIFHTFNTLHEAGKQVILTSDRPPKTLARLEERLRSRFEWGLIADVQPPDLETRLAILQRKAERDGLQTRISLEEDVLLYLAEQHPHNVRELEGALNKVAAYGMLTQTPISLQVVQQVLGLGVDPQRLSPADIIEVVAEYYHMRPGDIQSPSRSKEISHARQVAVYVLRTLTEASFPKIGEWLGGRKHSTILYAYEKVREDMAQSALLERQIQEIIQRVQQAPTQGRR
ncbi:MAG: chromosomal replication initiator protein DnaA [Candidatus Melainabacteria bacterium]|nr:chromosomal replication initiator protein DnaA [Candidatus Melainabacteria bacterium]